jgi:hypothetical protein
MYTKIYLWVVFIALVLSASCTSKDGNIAVTPSNPVDTTKVITDTIKYDSICFERDILPIFKSNCSIEACHDGITGQEGIVFDSYQTFFYKGFVKGDAANSQVYNAITRTTSRRMPPIPTYSLDSNQINIIGKWINQGMPENACKQAIDSSQYSYSAIIYPILKNSCFGCHNDKAEYPNSVLLQTYEQVKKYALNGQLLGTIKHQNGYKAMPENGAKMDSEYVRLIEKWIKNGALNN